MARSRTTVDGGKEPGQVVVLDGTGQALALLEAVAVGQDRADEVGVFVGQEGVEGDDGGQAAVDGGGLKAAGRLGGDEAVDVMEGNVAGWAVAGKGGELGEVDSGNRARYGRWGCGGATS